MGGAGEQLRNQLNEISPSIRPCVGLMQSEQLLSNMRETPRMNDRACKRSRFGKDDGAGSQKHDFGICQSVEGCRENDRKKCANKELDEVSQNATKITDLSKNSRVMPAHRISFNDYQ